MHSVTEIVSWTLLVVLLLGGLVGVFLPFLPGALIIFIGALLHKVLTPEWLSWTTVVILGVMVLVERLLDLLGTMVGARWLGATRWGILGAVVGGIVGIFFGLPGLILGPVFGALVGEIIFARRSLGLSARAGFGAAVGFGISTILRIALALFMIALVVADALRG
ncbi:MAG: DUF456 domain-containing protein [Opitutaceae bacterium]